MNKTSMLFVSLLCLAGCVNVPSGNESALGNAALGLEEIDAKYANYVLVFDTPSPGTKVEHGISYEKYVQDIATTMGKRGILYDFTNPRLSLTIRRETSLLLFDCLIRTSPLGEVATMDQGPFVVVTNVSPKALCVDKTKPSSSTLVVPLGIVGSSARDSVFAVIKEKAVFTTVSGTKENVLTGYVLAKSSRADVLLSGTIDFILDEWTSRYNRKR